MTAAAQLSDLELAALISSKICHDVIGPVGAIYNGLEVLDEDDDDDSRAYALEQIRNFTEQASAKLQFARFAFGAAGSAAAVIDLREAANISRGFVESGKHKLAWAVAPGQMPKDQVKLLLNMLAGAMTALPRGGQITVEVAADVGHPTFVVRCAGPRARPPQHLAEFIAGVQPEELGPLTIQPYYTCRLAEAAGMRLRLIQEGEDIIIVASASG